MKMRQCIERWTKKVEKEDRWTWWTRCVLQRKIARWLESQGFVISYRWHSASTLGWNAPYERCWCDCSGWVRATGVLFARGIKAISPTHSNELVALNNVSVWLQKLSIAFTDEPQHWPTRIQLFGIVDAHCPTELRNSNVWFRMFKMKQPLFCIARIGNFCWARKLHKRCEWRYCSPHWPMIWATINFKFPFTLPLPLMLQSLHSSYVPNWQKWESCRRELPPVPNFSRRVCLLVDERLSLVSPLSLKKKAERTLRRQDRFSLVNSKTLETSSQISQTFCFHQFRPYLSWSEVWFRWFWAVQNSLIRQAKSHRQVVPWCLHLDGKKRSWLCGRVRS